MRNKGSLLLILLIVAGCGGGAEKEAFERYEAQVNPTLEADAALRRQFDEKVDDARAFGNQDAFVELRRKKLRPFYTEMAEKVRAVKPEGRRLAEIHAELVRYADLWLEVLDGYAGMEKKKEAAEEASRTVVSNLAQAEKDLDGKAAALNEALNAEPLSLDAFAPVLRRDPGRDADRALEALKAGEIRPPSDYAQAVDAQLIPAYDQLKVTLASSEKAQNFPDVLAPALAYLDARLALLRASKELALVQDRVMKEFAPMTEALGQRLDEAMDTLEKYKESAKAYRDSMR